MQVQRRKPVGSFTEQLRRNGQERFTAIIGFAQNGFAASYLHSSQWILIGERDAIPIAGVSPLAFQIK